MRILDIDLDLFLNEYDGYSHDREDNSNIPFEEKKVRMFLEKNCGLSTENPVEGVMIEQHHEAFLYWHQLIEQNRLSVPFEIVHADMHSDIYTMYYPYILGDLMHRRIEDRVNYDKEKLHYSNYLVFALACGWINRFTYVTHYDWDDNDGLSDIYFKDFDPESGYIELGAYDKELLKNYSNLLESRAKPIRKNPLVPFTVINMDDYRNTEKFDFAVLCRSKEYTPTESDELIPIIMEYIKVI